MQRPSERRPTSILRLTAGAGWTAWLASVLLFAYGAWHRIHWSSLLGIVGDGLRLWPFLVAFALHARRDSRGLPLFAGWTIGEFLNYGFSITGAPQQPCVIGLLVIFTASVANRLLRIDRLSSRERISALALGALSAYLARALAMDCSELWFGPRYVPLGLGTTMTSEWWTTMVVHVGLELGAVFAVLSFLSGRTSGLVATVAVIAAWVAIGPTPPADVFCRCMGCPDHPLTHARDVLLLTGIAVAPWLGPIAHHLQTSQLADPRGVPGSRRCCLHVRNRDAAHVHAP